MTPCYDNGMVSLYQADARALPLADESVDCVVTSPPYWGLRDYGAEGQIGLEATPDEYVRTMVDVFREVWRVLKSTGTVWCNLGDSYAHPTSGGGGAVDSRTDGRKTTPGDKVRGRMGGANTMVDGLKPKDLVGIPWRVAFALQADGWYLRSDIIWSKPNPMPESVTDRPTKSHEYLFLLSKNAHYFYDADAIREPNLVGTHSRGGQKEDKTGLVKSTTWNQLPPTEHPGGRNKRTVWEIATQPTPEAHFATYPEALVEPCILAGTSAKGVCGACGKPWERVVERERSYESGSGKAGHIPGGKNGDRYQGGGVTIDVRMGPTVHTTTTGWQPTCSCNAPTVPATVLDPFIGSGTTAAVAQRLGRRAIGVDLSPAYLKLAAKRVGKVSLPMVGL